MREPNGGRVAEVRVVGVDEEARARVMAKRAASVGQQSVQ